MPKPEFDKFYKNRLFPDASEILELTTSSYDKIKANAIYVFDTNSLAVPYTAKSESVEQIKALLIALKKKDQLRIPGQVIREFAELRPFKINDIFSAISKKRNSFSLNYIDKYPLLSGLESHKELQKLETTLIENIKAYRDSLGVLLEEIRGWQWNDPVTVLYRDIITKELICEPGAGHDKIEEQRAYRYLHKIPPGYQDENKADSGIGDLIIWFTILAIGKAEKRPVIFVSGDQKSDWFHSSENQPLQVRFELIAEYFRESGGQTFHIMKLSELLKNHGASANIIANVANEEFTKKLIDSYAYEMKVEHAIMQWYSQRFNDIQFSASDSDHFDLEIETKDYGTMGIAIISATDDMDRLDYKRRVDRILRLADLFIYAAIDIILLFSRFNENEMRKVFDLVREHVYFNNDGAHHITVLGGYIDESGQLSIQLNDGRLH